MLLPESSDILYCTHIVMITVPPVFICERSTAGEGNENALCQTIIAIDKPLKCPVMLVEKAIFLIPPWLFQPTSMGIFFSNLSIMNIHYCQRV